MHTYIHAYIHTSTHTHTYIHTYIHIYAHIHTYIHTFHYCYVSSYLQVLDLSHNHLGDQGVAAIAAAFSAVEVADFRSNASSSSAGSTMNLLRLTVLDLSSNDLSDSAVLALCKVRQAYIHTLSDCFINRL